LRRDPGRRRERPGHRPDAPRGLRHGGHRGRGRPDGRLRSRRGRPVAAPPLLDEPELRQPPGRPPADAAAGQLRRPAGGRGGPVMTARGTAAETRAHTNYIHRLQDELAQARRLERLADEHLAELVAYLHSPKFAKDTTVQVNDVLTRLLPARSALGYA